MIPEEPYVIEFNCHSLYADGELRVAKESQGCDEHRLAPTFGSFNIHGLGEYLRQGCTCCVGGQAARTEQQKHPRHSDLALGTVDSPADRPCDAHSWYAVSRTGRQGPAGFSLANLGTCDPGRSNHEIGVRSPSSTATGLFPALIVCTCLTTVQASKS